jgi:hypothetical protein
MLTSFTLKTNNIAILGKSTKCKLEPYKQSKKHGMCVAILNIKKLGSLVHKETPELFNAVGTHANGKDKVLIGGDLAVFSFLLTNIYPPRKYTRGGWQHVWDIQ